MRYIGSKVNLLEEIDLFIKEQVHDNSTVFTDLFSGTGSVAEYFKKDYKVISNDNLFFSHVLQKAKIENNTVPTFPKLKDIGIAEPLSYLETAEFDITDDYFITKNYSPYEDSERMYLSVDNASRVDFIRQSINSWKNAALLSEQEFYYLLAILIEAVPFVSNISGTYGAYLKHWDKRALGKLKLEALHVTNNKQDNRAFNQDANELIKTIRGDILYIDTPYNARQYVTNYHVLETIARYDNPDIYGKTGLRPYEDQKSAYCSKREVYTVFEDLIKHAKHKHIIVSYSTDGILPIDSIAEILKRHGIERTYQLKKVPYRKYKSKHEQESNVLYELLFYVEKDIPTILDEQQPYDIFSINGITLDDVDLKPAPAKPVDKQAVKMERYTKAAYVKSPLNYIGGKHKLLGQIIPLFPENIHTFVDVFAGGLNVGINVKAEKIIANDINTYVVGVLNAFNTMRVEDILQHIHQRIADYQLSKENEEGFKRFRDDYNKNQHPLDLYTLICYSFNYQFRFNNNWQYNNPFGRNRSQFSATLEKKLVQFIETLQSKQVVISNIEFEHLNFDALGPNDFVYCDPPYLITTGSYNDGNRGFKDWNLQQEMKLLKTLDALHARGVNFALSNVLSHKGKTNDVLIEWAKNYTIHNLNHNYSNSSHNTVKGASDEVLITNY